MTDEDGRGRTRTEWRILGSGIVAFLNENGGYLKYPISAFMLSANIGYLQSFHPRLVNTGQGMGIFVNLHICISTNAMLLQKCVQFST